MTRRAIFTLGIMACALSQAARTQDARRLSAPTYYIAVSAQLDYGDTIRVRGASNLPPGASVLLEVLDSGRVEIGKRVCVTTNEEGLFDQEITISTGLPHGSNLLVRATFLTNACKQSVRVLQIVGDHGEFLGNDGDHSAKHKLETGLTPGMAKNPQLLQVSGFYYGISAIAMVA